MAKFYVNVAIELRQTIELEADSLEEAKKQVDSYIELDDLNNSDVVESYPVSIEDSNGNIIEDLV